MPSSASPTQLSPLFPTRRSSDLRRRAYHVDRGRRDLRDHVHRILGCGPACLPDHHRRSAESRVLPASWPAHRGRQQELRRVSREADRKSTRLNSSHLVISYAVFCFTYSTVSSLPYTTLFRSPKTRVSRGSRKTGSTRSRTPDTRLRARVSA